MDDKQVALIAEVTVRRYFDHYLEHVWPKQLLTAITAHNRDVTAHVQQIRVAVKAESSRLKLWLFGLIFTGGIGSGVGIVKAVTFLTSG